LGVAFSGVTPLFRPFAKLVHAIFDSANTIGDLRFTECRLCERWDGAAYGNESGIKAASNIFLHFHTPAVLSEPYAAKKSGVV
jgi:hypothetical protein